MMSSFVWVYTSLTKKKMSQKAVKKVTFDETALQKAPIPEINAWFGVPDDQLKELRKLEQQVAKAEADAAANAAAKAKAEAEAALAAKMAALRARLAELTA